MLSLLKISNVAIIENAEIEFTKGLNVLTGETGAGKSIILDALGAVLGFRTQKNIIRTGAHQASVSAVFSDTPQQARAYLSDYGIEPEQDGSLIISRIISEDKNICRVNGEPVTVAVLRELGGMLVSIHGQQDNRELLDDAAHLAYIDHVAAHGELLEAMAIQYGELTGVRGELEQALKEDADKQSTTQLLEYQINELELANIRVGEEQELKDRREIIRNSEKLLRLSASGRAALNGDEDAGGALSLIRDALTDLTRAATLTDKVRPLVNALDEAVCSIQAVADELRELTEQLQDGGQSPDDIEERLDLLYRLKQKYGNSEQELLDYLDNARERLSAIENADKNIARLTRLEAELSARAQKTAALLSAGRKKAAQRFTEAVAGELAFLDMPGVTLKARFSPRELCACGTDSVLLLISANVGETENTPNGQPTVGRMTAQSVSCMRRKLISLSRGMRITCLGKAIAQMNSVNSAPRPRKRFFASA